MRRLPTPQDFRTTARLADQTVDRLQKLNLRLLP